jgi:hypothetical protein
MAGSNAGTSGDSRTWLSGVRDRLQNRSTMVGVVVAVVVLVAAGGGAAVVLTGSGDGNASDPPAANLSVDVTADRVAVVHDSGETVDPGEIQVTVIVDGERSERDLTGFGNPPENPDSFAPGEQFATTGATYNGSVTVFVVHGPTDTRLADATVDVGQDSGPNPSVSATIEAVTNAEGGDLFVGDDVAVAFSLAAQNGTADPVVTVRVDGAVVFDERVTVEAGTSVTETVTGGADLADGLDVTVETNEGSVAETLAPPSFSVAFADDPDTSPASVGYTVENTGDIGDEQSLTLRSTTPDGSVLAETERTERVAGGGTVTGATEAVDLAAGGELTLSVATDTATIPLGESTFEVADLDVPAELVAGEDVSVGYTVENTGTFTDTQNVTFAVDGVEQQVDASVTLDAGETTDGEFAYTPGADATTGLTLAVGTADDTAEVNISVAAPADGGFTVGIDGTSAPVTPGGSLAVTATVENVGAQADTRSVTLAGSALATNSTQVSLDSGESTTVTLSGQVADTAAGTLDATVETPDDAASVAVSVDGGDSDPAAVFDIVGFDAPSEIEAGAALTVSYEVENTGDGAGTQDITFTAGGTTVDTAGDVTLDPGETRSDTFTYGTSGDATGAVTVEVGTDDDSASTDVSLSATTPGGEVVASLATASGAVGETVGVDLDVLSVDGTTRPFGSYTIVLTYDTSVLSFQGLSPGAWGSPASLNSEDDVVAVADFDPSGETPAEPALTFNFEVVGEGTAAIEFDDSAVPGDNTINDNDGRSYETTFEPTTVQGT